MPDKEIKETFTEKIKEKEIEKEKAAILVVKERMKSMTDIKRDVIEVKDETSAKALKTFKKLKAMLNVESKQTGEAEKDIPENPND